MMNCLNMWNDLEEDEEFEFRLLNELISNGIMHGNEKCETKSPLLDSGGK